MSVKTTLCKDNVSTVNNDNGITEHQTTIYPQSRLGTAITLLTMNRIYNKIVFWCKHFFFYQPFPLVKST